MALRTGIEAAFAAMHTASQKLLQAIALTANVSFAYATCDWALALLTSGAGLAAVGAAGSIAEAGGWRHRAGADTPRCRRQQSAGNGGS